MREGTAGTTTHDADDPLGELHVLPGADEAAFVRLYDEVADRAYGIALRVLGDAVQAQDVVRDVFLEAWRTFATDDPDLGSAAGRVLTDAHRRAVDRVRASTATRRSVVSWPDAGQPGSGIEATQGTAEADLEARPVVAALRSLSPLELLAIELAYVRGYTNAEVAHLMQAPVGTTRTRLRTGLRRLREQLATPPAVHKGPGAGGRHMVGG